MDRDFSPSMPCWNCSMDWDHDEMHHVEIGGETRHICDDCIDEIGDCNDTTDSEPDDDPVFADQQALASAGFGDDEDYYNDSGDTW